MLRLSPKIESASERMKNAKKAITKPIRAAMMWFRALSTFALSPPDVIQRIPPKTRKKRAIITAIARRKPTPAPTMDPRLFELRLQSLLKLPALAHGLRPCAYTGRANANVERAPVVAVKNFFISTYSS